MAAIRHKTLVEQSLTSHLTNHQSMTIKTYWALIQKYRQTHNRRSPVDSYTDFPVMADKLELTHISFVLTLDSAKKCRQGAIGIVSERVTVNLVISEPLNDEDDDDEANDDNNDIFIYLFKLKYTRFIQ